VDDDISLLMECRGHESNRSGSRSLMALRMASMGGKLMVAGAGSFSTAVL